MLQKITTTVLVATSALHLLFVVGEMLPLGGIATDEIEPPTENWPLLLQKVMNTRELNKAGEEAERPVPRTLLTNSDEQERVVTIVQNAGIYNVIMTVGFLFAAFPSRFSSDFTPSAIRALRIFFCSGAILAGVFGLTLSGATIVQAVAGALGLVCVLKLGAASPSASET